MSESRLIDRRTFMRRGAMGAGALWALPLGELAARKAYGAVRKGPSPYGDPVPTIDATTGLPLLALPAGFRYFSFGWTGDPMNDGVRTPGAHDGMAVIDTLFGNPDWLVLVRNHEQGGGAPFIGNRPDITYGPNPAAGGTTNLVFDARQERFLKANSSLAGTTTNCAGGVTPWHTWITCEESDGGGHGWSFDVGAFGGDPAPIFDMGRFRHEACMVDPATGWVYQTEDNGSNSGFYRFIPDVVGQLKQGGRLQMLKVEGQDLVNITLGSPLGTIWEIEWVDIADPRATNRSVFNQGRDLMAANFRRLEGCWWGNNTGFFLATEGGGSLNGQVFEFDPLAQTIKLIYESPTHDDLDNPDNMVVTPRGGIILCEDQAAGSNFTAGERLIGLQMHGEVFTFAQNTIVLPVAYNDRVPAGNYTGGEFAGACYSPDGKWLFVNVQSPGVTFAITGPWGTGPL
jgi:uncharacterized protein